MCLSAVYLEKKIPETKIMEEASMVAESGGDVLVQSLFGEKKMLSNHFIHEVNLLEHYVVVKKREEL